MSFISNFDNVMDCPGLSLEEMGLLMYFFRNRGNNFIFITSVILQKFHVSKPTYLRIKKSLIDKGVIESISVYRNGRVAGCKITVLFENIQKAKAKKTEVKNSNLNNIDRNNSDQLEKRTNREVSKEIKEGSNTHTSSSVASAPAGAAASVCVPPQPASIPPKTETVPPEEQTSPVRPRNRKQTVPVSENPPSLEDIKAYIPEVLRGKGITGWTEQDIHSTAYDIWNRYTNNRWTTAKGDPMYSWENAVTGWILRNNGIPQRMAPVNQQQGQPQNGKSFKQQERDYANRYLIDPIGTAISDCVNQSIIAGGDPCDWGLAPQFHDEAMKLMETRKEQALSGHTPAAPIDIFGIGFGGKE